MKLRYIVFVMCLLLLWGCAESRVTPAAEDSPSAEDVTPSDIPSTPDEVPDSFPYNEMLDASFSYFSEPTYDSMPVGVVGKSGEYAILGETSDSEGNLWGKLDDEKWVDLTYAREFASNPPPITANHADGALLAGDYYEFSLSSGVDGVAFAAFRATENLKNLKLTSLTWEENGFAEVNTYYTLPELTPEKPLVAKLMFLGSGTIYGISFEDADGVMRYFSVSESGRNGEIVINEYTVK